MCSVQTSDTVRKNKLQCVSVSSMHLLAEAITHNFFGLKMAVDTSSGPAWGGALDSTMFSGRGLVEEGCGITGKYRKC